MIRNLVVRARLPQRVLRQLSVTNHFQQSLQIPSQRRCFSTNSLWTSNSFLSATGRTKFQVATTVIKRSMFIQTQDTPNPDSLKFLPGETVLEKGTMNFANFKDAQKSGLAKQLFKIEGVTGVFFGHDFITVNKDTKVPWHLLKPHIFGEISDYYASGKPIYSEGETSSANTDIKDDDSEVVAMIKELLETRVRPAVQADGGDIVYRGFDSGVVLLQMHGSCSGCPSSAVTLKSGIERMLMHWIPEVIGVMAVTDDDLTKINLEAFNSLEKKLEKE